MNIIFLLFRPFFCSIITSRLFHRKSVQDSNALSIKMQIKKKASESLIPHSRAFKYFQCNCKPCREQLHAKNSANGIKIADSVKNNGVLVISLSLALIMDTTLKRTIPLEGQGWLTTTQLHTLLCRYSLKTVSTSVRQQAQIPFC